MQSFDPVLGPWPLNPFPLQPFERQLFEQCYRLHFSSQQSGARPTTGSIHHPVQRHEFFRFSSSIAPTMSTSRGCRHLNAECRQGRCADAAFNSAADISERVEHSLSEHRYT